MGISPVSKQVLKAKKSILQDEVTRINKVIETLKSQKEALTVQINAQQAIKDGFQIDINNLNTDIG